MNGNYLVAILGLAMLMVVHEMGHFLAARAFGMRVTRFSIGFGPTFFKVVPRDGYFWFTTAADKVRLRLWKHDPEKHGPTVYQLAMIPFLAYVQIAGMNPLEEVDSDDKGSYANASLIGRIVTIFGGPFANYAFASIFFFFFHFLIGGQTLPRTTAEVNPLRESPAEVAGLKRGDVVVEIARTPVKDWESMAAVISSHPGDTIPIVVERDGARIELSITPAPNAEGKGKIGVGNGHHVEVLPKEAAYLAVVEPALIVKTQVVGIGLWISGKAEGKLGGPKLMVDEAAKAAKQGLPEFLGLLGFLSAIVGAFNLIPFPALDGGRLLFLGFEATTRRRANAQMEAKIHAVGLVMMLCLIAYVTVFNDFKVGAK